CFFFSSRRRHTRCLSDWSSDVCSSDLELDAILGAMRIEMERDRLHRELVEKLDQLQASRQRLVQAADVERRRLERNLHDGAQQRLIVVLLGLRGLEKRVVGDPELTQLAAQSRAELEGALEDLRELARGLHPPLLAQRGLAAARPAGGGTRLRALFRVYPARSQARPAASTTSSRGATSWRSPIASPAQPSTLNGRRKAVSGMRTSSSSTSAAGRSTPSTGVT